ncbi:hypothetical protein F5Y19DRAFT_481766 [Xylariaceae sp. FL1651]|nr:hypothetical protein F5Y19DRAFT_481766 [Xylariaceae sp. FL1651]
MDWTFTNVTAGGTHLLVTSETTHVGQTYPVYPQHFEMRVSNWGYGVQIDKVHVGAEELLIMITSFSQTIEFIGDSLSVGDFQSYKDLSSLAYGVGEGFGHTEYYMTAIPGTCVTDQDYEATTEGRCTSDSTLRTRAGKRQQSGAVSRHIAIEARRDEPEPWNFKKIETTPDIVVISQVQMVTTK